MSKDPTKANPYGNEEPQLKYEAGIEDFKIKGKEVLVFDDIVYSGKTLKSLEKILKKRGATGVKLYALMDARKDNSIELDGACIKGEFDKAYFGVGMDVLGVGGIKDGKYKQDIWEAGKRKPKAKHDGRRITPKKEQGNGWER